MPVCYTKKNLKVVKKTDISQKNWLNSPNWPENIKNRQIRERLTTKLNSVLKLKTGISDYKGSHVYYHEFPASLLVYFT